MSPGAPGGVPATQFYFPVNGPAKPKTGMSVFSVSVASGPSSEIYCHQVHYIVPFSQSELLPTSSDGTVVFLQGQQKEIFFTGFLAMSSNSNLSECKGLSVHDRSKNLLSKSVIPSVYVKLAETLRGKPARLTIDNQSMPVFTLLN